jgi:hypothetical protein
MTTDQSVRNPWSVLHQFGRRSTPVERCELCSATLTHEHPHLIELSTRKILCSCGACALLFDGGGSHKYKRVGRRIQLLDSFHISDAQWDALLIPINMAFFFLSSAENRVVALYPSPAGAVESLLSLQAWNDIVQENPSLRSMEADVEALVVNRLGNGRGPVRSECFLAPIDECYKLVGLIRAHWRGLSGGSEAWQEITRFFNELRERAQVVSERPHV